AHDAARRRGAAAGPSLAEVPDKRLASRDVGAWVPALDRDAEAAAPAGHRAVGTGRRQRLDDRLDDLVAAMIRGQRHRRAGVGPDHGARLGDDRDWTKGAVVLR